jgi:hypothetical protein
MVAGVSSLGYEVEDDRLAAEVGQADALAGVGRRGEIGCLLALGDHVGSVVVAGGLRASRRQRKQPAAPGEAAGVVGRRP